MLLAAKFQRLQQYFWVGYATARDQANSVISYRTHLLFCARIAYSLHHFTYDVRLRVKSLEVKYLTVLPAYVAKTPLLDAELI
jgi:hypothetical protein